jgi:ribulose-bisphosphate carboxylase small chain
MHVTQGTFSYLPPLSDDEIRAQIQYGIDQDWAVAIEFTDDIHPRNVYWEMWGFPDFDAKDAAAGLFELNRCREAYPNHYIRVTLYNPKLTKQTIGLQFIVNRPPNEPGFRLDRQESNDRVIRYTLQPYATEKPHGDRYQEGAYPDYHGN